MKKLSIGVMACALLFVAGCKKDEPAATNNNNNNNNTPAVVFEAKVNGVLFSTEYASYFKGTNPKPYYNITSNYLDGNTNESTSFSLSFYGETTGTYTITTDTSTKAEATYRTGIAPGGVTYVAQSGSITITKLDLTNNKMSGTFNFVAKDVSGNTKTITDGKLTDLPKF